MDIHYTELLALPVGHTLAQTSAEAFQDEYILGLMIWFDELDEQREVINTHQIFDGRSVLNPNEIVQKVMR